MENIDCSRVDVNGQIDLLKYPSPSELFCRNNAYELEWERRGRSVSGKRKAHNITSTEELYDMPEIGDVKTSIKAADHSSWYLLDGRATSTLPAAVQPVAASLGYGTNLPDLTGCFLMGGTGSVGNVAGDNNRLLTQDHLPNVTLNGTTSAEGAHGHNIQLDSVGSFTAGTYVGGFSATSGSIQEGSAIGISGDHTHTVGVDLNPTVQTPVDIRPKHYVVKYFIWME